MVWVCQSCGLENANDSASICRCGEKFAEDSVHKINGKKIAQPIRSNKKVHILLLIIFFGGLAAGYIWIPTVALTIDLIFWISVLFIPIENK